MLTENIKFQLDTLERDVQEWQRRFKQDSRDRLFINYIFISEKIKDKARLSLDPAIQDLQQIKEQYGEKYRIKDLSYHVGLAINTCEFLKNILKEIYDLYQKQEEYEKIKMTWHVHFSSFLKRITSLRERIYILDTILVKEEVEKDL